MINIVPNSMNIMFCLVFTLLAVLGYSLSSASPVYILTPFMSKVKRGEANLEKPETLFLPEKQMESSLLDHPLIGEQSKKSTFLINKLRYALENAINKEEKMIEMKNKEERNKEDEEEQEKNRKEYLLTPSAVAQLEMQRRGQQQDGRVYWRCYFNAVSCF